jgi:hypothetical protein
MKQNLTNETSALVVGLGIAIGECIFGVNGPFLLSRFGLNVPGAAVLGVLMGAAVGYSVTTAALRLHRREKASGQTGHHIVVDAQLSANLRA